jgi:hypothetical protein
VMERSAECKGRRGTGIHQQACKIFFCVQCCREWQQYGEHGDGLQRTNVLEGFPQSCQLLQCLLNNVCGPSIDLADHTHAHTLCVSNAIPCCTRSPSKQHTNILATTTRPHPRSCPSIPAHQDGVSACVCAVSRVDGRRGDDGLSPDSDIVPHLLASHPPSSHTLRQPLLLWSHQPYADQLPQCHTAH